MNLDLNASTPEILEAMGLGPHGQVQMRIDAAVIRYMEDYTPMITGTLMDDPRRWTDIGSGEIVYKHPGARYLYYGEIYGPNIPIFGDDTAEPMGWFSPPGKRKYPTGRPLTYNQDAHPMAGPFWFDRCMADHLNDILEEALA